MQGLRFERNGVVHWWICRKHLVRKGFRDLQQVNSWEFTCTCKTKNLEVLSEQMKNHPAKKQQGRRRASPPQRWLAASYF